jgi:chromosome transmission fidelity protein 8
MQIRVRCSCGEGSCLEWAIMEFQGVVEAQPGFHDSLPNLQIGTLSSFISGFSISHYQLILRPVFTILVCFESFLK